MTVSLLSFGLLRGSLRSYLLVVLTTLIVVLALPVAAVFSLGGDAVRLLSKAPSAAAAQEQGFYMGGEIPGNAYAWGNCTYWVFAERLWANRPIPAFWGNANMWDESARRDGYELNHLPKVGAIMQTDEGQWGHVAYVTAVDTLTGTWTISEMNAPRLNVISSRTFPASAAAYYDFIHDKKEAGQ